MRYLKISILFGFLFFSFISLGQEIELEGRLLNEENIEGVHVLNNTAKKFTITDENGGFLIEAKEQDTIYFNSLVYKLQGFVITDEMISQGRLDVLLQEDVNELDEVVVGRRLTGDINKDMKQAKIKDTINFDDVGIPGFQGEPQEKIVPIIPAIGFGVAMDIEAIYKHITGYYKSLKTGRKWDKQNGVLADLYDYYGHDFFVSDHNIPEDRLYEFLLLCVENEGFVDDFKKGNFELVLKVIREKSENFGK